jgi:hypothetical protein
MHKYIRFYIALLSLSILCTFWIQSAGAFSFILSKEQIDTILTETFPYRLSAGSMEVVMSDPSATLLQKEQKLALALSLNLKDLTTKEQMKARAHINGNLAFDKGSQQIQLVKPQIKDFKVIQGKSSPAGPTLEQINQVLGKELPVIILIDIKQFSGGFPVPSVSSITVVKNGIEVTF